MDDQAKPEYRLFSPGQVTLATVIGSFLAGAILMALNYRRLGQPAAARKAFRLAAAALVALAVAGPFLPESSTVSIGLAVGSVVAMNQLANQLQGSPCRSHAARGGRTGSGLAVVGIAILCLVGVLALMFLSAYAAEVLTTAASASPGHWGND